MTGPVESPHLHQLPSPVGSVETQPGYHLAALTAFRVGDVPIMAARNKDSKTFQPQRCGLTSMTVIETLVVVGKPYDSLEQKMTVKRDGKVTASGRIVVSTDGKSRTVTTSGTDAEGK